jgi:hypothetical protein
VSDAESRFVLVAVREPDSASRATLESAAGAVRDWDRVTNLARVNGVSALVAAAAHRAGLALPPSAAAALHDEEIACVATTALLDRELARALSACAVESVGVTVLKGPALARTLYADRALRPYADLDLVVRREDGERFAAVCRRLGFQEVESGAWSGRAAESPFHRRFIDKSGRALIELHSDPLQLGLAPVDEEARWSRSLAAPWLGGVGAPARILGNADQLVQLSVHAHKHGFDRLIWLKDIDLLVRAPSALSWGLVRSTAACEGVSASVWYALRLCADLLRTPLPAPARTLRPSPITRVLYQSIWPSGSVAELEPRMHRLAVQFDVAESWRGMLPSVLLMGRRPERLRLLAREAGRRFGLFR